MFEEKLSFTPTKPGVYLLKGQRDRILYVGKAKNLRERLKAYFQRPETLDQRKAAMTKLVADYSYVVTENELEALVLEANLIKEYKPRFNVILRDDKHYPYLKVTMREEWPRIEVVRRIEKDGSLYFGPYVPAQGMWAALSFIRQNFPIRTCAHLLDRPMRPCVQHQIGRCSGPCAGLVSRDEYLKIVNEVILFLKGERKELLTRLEKKMEELSRELKFEEAAQIRDRMSSLMKIWESQKVIAPELGNSDVIGFSSEGPDVFFVVFFIRNGIMIGTKDFFVKGAGSMAKDEMMQSFLELFYAKEIIPPDEIIVPVRPDDHAGVRTWLGRKRGRRVVITVPRKGKKSELLTMAEENASQLLKGRGAGGFQEMEEEIRERLRLSEIPHSIGAFDVSTIAGSESVGAFVFWADGEFVKDSYRHLKIKGVSGVDDYAMMKELIGRTLQNLGDMMPDLIVIDGGKGQLDVARGVFEQAEMVKGGRKRPMLVAVAKDPDRAFTLDDRVIDLDDSSRFSLFLRRIRDEVHRFAITYHRKLRDKRLMESPLESVPGIGKRRRLELLRRFGSIDAIRNASVEEIAGLKGFNKKIAEGLSQELRRVQ